MRNTRFIFVEGIMGAGKSTTAVYLTQHIRQQGYAARFVAEGPTIDEPKHPLRVATEYPHPNAIWQDLTAGAFIERSLHKWRTFVQEAQKSATVTVCDGLLFHGNMTDAMLLNADIPMLSAYIEQVVECLLGLNPVVIYFYHRDIAQAIRAICDERGKRWEAYQLNWKLGSPYSVQRGLQGFDGFVQLYQNYRAICDDIFAQLPKPKLAISNEGEWARYYREILEFLELAGYEEESSFL